MLSSIWNRLRTIFVGSTSQNISHRTLTTDTKENTSEASTTIKPTLQLSDSCLRKLVEITNAEAGKYLRVSVDGGGCSGFQYKFELDDKINEDDKIFGKDNGKLVIDTVSLEYCDGSTIDYHAELIRSGFRVVANPKAEQGCSCGASFALKMDWSER